MTNTYLDSLTRITEGHKGWHARLNWEPSDDCEHCRVIAEAWKAYRD